MLWPNAESAVNSDPWLVANHDRIRSLRLPRSRRAVARPQPADPVHQLRPRRGLRDGERGNVHFTPNGRFDYDLDNPERGLSTIETWRQNMPGLDNTALDDEGRAMKSWWPFLFY